MSEVHNSVYKTTLDIIIQDFVRVVAHFRPVKKNPVKNKLNTRMEKLHFAFRMYDLDGDDKISKVIFMSRNESTDPVYGCNQRLTLQQFFGFP